MPCGQPRRAWAPPVGELGLQDARGAGAEEDRDAVRAVLGARLGHGLAKTVLGEADLREAVVAAIEFGQRARDRLVLQARDAPDVGAQLPAVEIVGFQSARAAAQRVEHRAHAPPQGSGCSVGGYGERFHLRARAAEARKAAAEPTVTVSPMACSTGFEDQASVPNASTVVPQVTSRA